MIEIIREKIKNIKTKDEQINFIREFLQILILKILKDKNYFKNIAFLGGTALRILYDLQRYSEDLDFSITQKSNYDFIKFLTSIKKEFELLNIDVEFKYKENVVNSAFVKFTNILNLLDLSAHRDEKLLIKLEVDTNPPKGEVLEEKLINKNFMFSIIAYDISSLMAGKLHAVLFRKYAKGRDFYDLVWYLAKNIEPNIKLLNNACIQSHGGDLGINNKNWQKVLFDRIESLDFKKIQNDVLPFLKEKSEAEMINLQTLKKLLNQ